MSVRDRVLAPFERWSSTAFIVGGIGILGTTVTGSLQVASVVESPSWLQGGPLLFGLWSPRSSGRIIAWPQSERSTG